MNWWMKRTKNEERKVELGIVPGETNETAANNQQNLHRRWSTYMWSILTLISKNFIFTFSRMHFDWIGSMEYVYWTTGTSVKREPKQPRMKEERTKPEAIGKGTKWVFMFVHQHRRRQITQTHTQKGAQNFYLKTQTFFIIVIIAFCCLLSFLNLHSPFYEIVHQ